MPVAAPHEEGGIEEFSDPVSDPQQLPTSSNLLRGMATCHSLTYIKGNIVGDTLDMKMFESTGWVMNTLLDDAEKHLILLILAMMCFNTF